ncbi:MAG: Multidrug resistance protein MdtA precursor [Pelotomaculum sp. PtaB.Bin104]|nr:MAG: Multidrug resistance protein MdtA precursor [Pelotomaculum sp. PtaB.Bin104]
MGKRIPVIGASILTGVFMLSLTLSGCGNSLTTQASGAKSPAVPVAVETAKRGDVVKELVASGQLVGEQSVVVSPKITGKVASVPVEVGSAVNAGDVLFTLDDFDIRVQVQQSEASVSVAQAKQKVAEDSRDNAAKQYDRYKQLFEQGAVSADTFDSYALKLQQAQSEEPEATLAQSQAALAYQRNQLANTVIVSPIAGIVALRNVDVGGVVSSTTQAITVVDLSRVKVQVSVGEQQIGKIKQGQEVKVFVPAVRADSFTGVVANLSPAADAKTKGYMIEVKMDNPGQALKQGMFAEVHIATDRSEGALTVPVNALVARSDGSVVYTVQNGVAKEVQVKAGISDGRVTEITGGLQEGDQVVVLGQQSLVDGARVLVGGGEDKANSQPGAQGKQPN